MTRLLSLLLLKIGCLVPAAAQDSNLSDMLQQTREKAGLVGAGFDVIENGYVVFISFVL